jgi:rubrerythrin
MMKMWICSVCKHVALGAQAPDKCPVCGVGAEKFSEFNGVQGVKGTRTEENLKSAFAGESQANRKYLAFALQAELVGNQEAAEAFRQAAEDETAHAHAEFALLGLVGDTKANLQAAIDGEAYEDEHMYPGFAKTAREEGFEDIAKYFEAVARHERRHAKKYVEILAKL